MPREAPVTRAIREARVFSIVDHFRHARPCAGHPRLCRAVLQTWMAGTSPEVTTQRHSGLVRRTRAQMRKHRGISSLLGDAQDNVDIPRCAIAHLGFACPGMTLPVSLPPPAATAAAVAVRSGSGR